MVVNCMVVAIAMHEERLQELRIYHVGTSLTNPIKLGQIKQLMYDYCKDNPLLSQNQNEGMQQLITFTSFSTFQTYIRTHYYPFLAVKFFIFSNLISQIHQLIYIMYCWLMNLMIRYWRCWMWYSSTISKPHTPA